MSHFDDLTVYTYFSPEEDAPETLNVGWIDDKHPFPVGRTSEDFRAKLQRLCLKRVQQTHGRYGCDFCRGPRKPSGSAEIRVQGDNCVYAAPELIGHYVVAHNYLPPEAFIKAVLAAEEAADAPDEASGTPNMD